MTPKILVVDDEPDLEDLVRQRFRRPIKEDSIAFGFARDGVEALAFLAENPDFDMEAIDDFADGTPRFDDVTLLALRWSRSAPLEPDAGESAAQSKAL